MDSDVLQLKEWFNKTQRDFPWRKKRSPYVVLVSEIMLQQTKAVAVLPYFISWMKKFPDFEVLAKAHEDQVIKAWEGLGYYSRARNLKNIAIRVLEEFDGNFPSDYESILSFKGIGPYTAAAISHLAFDKRAVGADGNIKKVIARYYGYVERIDKGNKILELLDRFLPVQADKDIFEGLIELGATICTKKRPKCNICPLQENCVAYLENSIDRIPLLKKREKTIFLNRVVFLLVHKGQILVKKEKKKLMNGLYEFPYLEKNEEKSISDAISAMEGAFSSAFTYVDQLEEVQHSFTKYKATLTPIICTFSKTFLLSQGFEFVDSSKLDSYPFSSGHRKIVNQYLLHCS